MADDILRGSKRHADDDNEESIDAKRQKESRDCDGKHSSSRTQEDSNEEQRRTNSDRDQEAIPSQFQVNFGNANVVLIGEGNNYYNNPSNLNVDKAENKLRDFLCKKAKVFTDLLENESFPLQVAKQSKPQREVFGRRGRFDETNSDDDSQLYDMYQLFKQCIITSKSRANRQCRSQEAKEDYIRKNGNVVGANGIAGIGKTTMIKLIAKYTNDTPKSIFIFYVLLRNIDFSKPCSVLQFLTSSMLSDWDHTPASDKALLKRINEADDVHIFTDALDEARGLNVETEAPTMNLYDIATPDVIFKNLYSGHLLPKAKKLLTSRPGAYHDLHPNYKPDFSVTVLGLNKESQELVCQQICENADDAVKVKAMFASNPSLSSLCFIPMFCKMTVLYLLQNFTSDVLLSSASDMFAFSLDQCVRSEHFKGDVSNVRELTKLALDGFCKNKLTFDFNDLQAAGVDKATVDAFMSINVVGNKSTSFRILDGDKQYYFSHLLWHEFFAAVQLIFCSSDDQFREFSQHFNEYRWYSVVKFLFGLSNPLVLSKIQSIFPPIPAGDLSHKLDLLKSFLQSSMQRFCDTALHSFPSLITYIEVSCFSQFFKHLFATDREKLILICSWVCELQDDDVTKFFAKLLPENILLDGSILPSDVTCLRHVLTNTQDIRCLSVGTYSAPVMLVGEGLKLLLQYFHTSSHKLKKLHVTTQEVDISYFTDFLNHIDELSLKSCNLSLDDVQQIFQALRQRHIPIEYLDLSRNPIISSSIEDCVRALPMIRALRLDHCILSEDFIEKLANAIECLDLPMTALALSANEIGIRSMKNLSRCIHKLQSLQLVYCELSGNKVEVLANKIAELDEPMKMLNLTGNVIESSGCISLAQCIHKIQSLNLDNCKVTGADIEMLAENIKDLKKPMKLLNLTDNDIGSTGAKYLCQCLHKVQHLWICGCELIGKDMEMLADAILQRNQPLEMLLIARNRIEVNGATAISRCLDKIKLLVIDQCKLSQEGIEVLQSTNSRNEQKCGIFGLEQQ